MVVCIQSSAGNYYFLSWYIWIIWRPLFHSNESIYFFPSSFLIVLLTWVTLSFVASVNLQGSKRRKNRRGRGNKRGVDPQGGYQLKSSLRSAILLRLRLSQFLLILAISFFLPCSLSLYVAIRSPPKGTDACTWRSCT